MYRVNSQGIFNVPFNKVTQEKLFIYDCNNIEKLHHIFNRKNLHFYNYDYQTLLKKPQAGHFVFCDPPYDYEEGTKGFVAYTKNGFNQESQKQLAKRLIELHQRGVKFMLTNHETTLIKNLYNHPDFHIIPIRTNRSINSDGTSRKLTGKEVIIINYEI